MIATTPPTDDPAAKRRRTITIVLAVIGTVLVSVATSFFAFGQSQAASIVRLEESESEDARQRQVDQATIVALNDAVRIAQARLAELETAIAVNETRIGELEQDLEQLQDGP